MVNIKKGSLVKAWDDLEEGFVIAKYFGNVQGRHHIVDTHMGERLRLKNVIEIPSDVAKQLYYLGL